MSGSKLKVLDLFSGIGGFSLGLENTGGFETVSFCEIDPDCRKILKKHWPDVPIIEDVKSINKETLPSDIDVICGGFPCQDISVAGKQKGLEGDRSGLWFEFKKIIQEVKPRYAIIENVANLRSKGLATLLKDLWQIGYDCEWHIISASSIGAVHRRERIWIIAYPRCRHRWPCDKGDQEELRRGQTTIKEIRTQDTLETERSSARSETNARRLEDRETTDPCGKRSQGWVQRLGEDESMGEKQVSGKSDIQTSKPTPNTDHLRLWKSFATEKSKQEWWAKATASFRNWWQTESSICRVDDGVQKGLHKGYERERRARVKQLGNSVVPQIPQFIGQQILNYENKVVLRDLL